MPLQVTALSCEKASRILGFQITGPGVEWRPNTAPCWRSSTQKKMGTRGRALGTAAGSPWSAVRPTLSTSDDGARPVSPSLPAGHRRESGLPGEDARSELPYSSSWALTCPPSSWTFLDLSLGREVQWPNQKPSGEPDCLLIAGPPASADSAGRGRLGCSAGNSRGGWKGVCKAFWAARPVWAVLGALLPDLQSVMFWLQTT